MKRILVVEDNEINRALIRDILNLRDFEIIEAEDGQEGIDLARRHKPDLILMDIQLPVMDGISATRILKGGPETRDIPMIALTSYAYEKDRRSFLEAGGDGFISKPIDVDELLRTIETVLSEKDESDGKRTQDPDSG